MTSRAGLRSERKSAEEQCSEKFFRAGAVCDLGKGHRGEHHATVAGVDHTWRDFRDDSDDEGDSDS
jgi:hypothetical protein